MGLNSQSGGQDSPPEFQDRHPGGQGSLSVSQERQLGGLGRQYVLEVLGMLLEDFEEDTQLVNLFLGEEH